MATATATPPGTIPTNLDTVVEQYIKLRDQKAALKAKYEADVEAIERALEKCEAFFLKQMQTLGLDSLPTPHGVPYRSTRTSATVGDPMIFRGWVIENEAWHMLDLKANKTAVASFKEENNDLPPGVNWREEIVVNVRRGK